MKPEPIQLTDIDISTLKLVKEVVVWFGDQDHSRWICRTTKHKPLAGLKVAYIKLWNPTYIRRDNILQAIESGFYDVHTTPALKALIFHQGMCRGYVMQPCQPNRNLDPNFYELIKRKTAVTGYFHVQFSRFHVLKFKDTFSLIDLEGVHPLHDLPRLSDIHCVFDFPDYEQFVRDLFWQNYGELQGDILPPLPQSETPASRSQLWRKPLALYNSCRRQLAIKWGILRHNMHLIET